LKLSNASNRLRKSFDYKPLGKEFASIWNRSSFLEMKMSIWTKVLDFGAEERRADED
jgi:hypothetical protein